MDMNDSVTNEKYEDLEEMYVIFITETDVLKQSLPIYHVERKVVETNINFNDGMHIVCVNAGDMYYDTLRGRVRHFKEDERGIRSMCEIWDEVRQEGIEIGEERGKTEEKIQMTINLWKKGIHDLDLIQEVFGLPLTKIKQVLEL